jgi:LPXTG-motif cell wall-anchored protein
MGRLAILLVAAGLLVIGGGAAAVYAQTTSTVGMREFEFDPANLTVSPGRVTFTLNNEGQFPHNLHIEGNGMSLDVKPDGPVAGGDSFTGAVTLPAGTYDTWCPVGNHRERGMVGELTVAGAGGAAAPAAPAAPAARPAAGAPAQVPSALPRTGDASNGLPLASAGVAVGLVLVAGGLFLRRRAGVHD